MKIQWERLKNAESGWKLSQAKRTEIFENCLQGRKVHRTSWQNFAVPAAYLGVAAAMCLIGFLLWPYIARPNNEPTEVIGGSATQAGSGSQVAELQAAYYPVQIVTKEYRAEGDPDIYKWYFLRASDGTLLEESGSYEVGRGARYEAKNYYDDQWRLIRTESEAEAGDTTKTYIYDDQNRIIKRVSITQGPNLGGVTQYRYDGRGRLILAETTFYRGVVEDLYTADAAYSSEKRSYEYDASGRLAQMRHDCDGGVFWIYTCTYDGQGNLTQLQKEDAEGQIEITLLTYDENNRCIEAQMGARTIQYAYDEAGNIAQEAQYQGGALVSEREYTYRLFQAPNAYSAFPKMPMEEVLGDLRGLDIGPIISDGNRYKTQGNVRVEKVVYGKENQVEQLTAGDLGEHFDYEIYYFGIQDFYLNINGEVVELRQALKENPAILQRLYDRWKMEHGSYYMYDDGGTCEYPYEDYNAIKKHQISSVYTDESSPPKLGYNEDLILTKPDMNLGDVDDFIPAG